MVRLFLVLLVVAWIRSVRSVDDTSSRENISVRWEFRRMFWIRARSTERHINIFVLDAGHDDDNDDDDTTTTMFIRLTRMGYHSF